MKIGILGSGDVAKTLGAGFLKHGYEVMLGTRTASKLADWQRQHAPARVGSFADTAQFGEMIVLAVKGTAAADSLNAAGPRNLAGKTVIDATNPIAETPPVNGVLKFFTGPDESLLERLQAQCKDAHFVKAFNSVGNA
jgi:predicted dinucleotide-binding enzyme